MKNFKKYALYGFGASVLAASSAQAALSDADIDPIVSGLTADASLLFTKFLPLLGLVLGFTVAMSLVKRFTAKAT